MLSYCRLEPVKTPLINKFYKSQKYNRTASREDTVWVAKSDSTIIAGCIFKQVFGCQFLTGVFVCPEFRSKGVARKLLTNALKEQQQVITFPIAALASFYTGLGFVKADPEQLDEELKGRYKAYNKHPPNLECMIYKPTSQQ